MRSDKDKGPDYNRHNLELRAADFYASIRKPESEWKSIDDLAPQLAEFEHRVRAGDYDGAYWVLNPIDSRYLFLWGHYTRLVELREKLLERLAEPDLQATNLGRLGSTYRALGQTRRAAEFYEEARSIFHDIGDRQNEAIWLGELGSAYRILGQYERAARLYEQALAINRERGDRRQESVQLGRLGMVCRALGQVEQAVEFCQQALAIAREIGVRAEEGRHLVNLGNAYPALGRFEQAIEAYEQALVIARELSDRWVEGAGVGNMGSAYRALGQVEQAINLYQEALAIDREIGDRRHEGVWLGNLGDTYSTLGQFERAVGYYKEGLVIAREVGDRRGESYRLLGLGKVLLANGELSEARRRCAEARDLDVPQTSYQVALALGIVLLHQRDPAAGETFADAAARCWAMLDRTAGLYKARYTLAAVLVGRAVCDPRWAEEGQRAGLLASALEEYRRALENCAAPGVVRDALRDLEMIQAAGVAGLEPAFELLESV